MAPVLVFTAEEVWGTRYPDEGSVHFSDWPEVDAGWVDTKLEATWAKIRAQRMIANEMIEPLRREKIVGSSLEIVFTYPGDPGDIDLAEILIVSTVQSGPETLVAKTGHHKCGRCWRHLPEVTDDGALCGRCDEVVNG